MYTSTFTAALFTVDIRWRQPECPIEDWIKKTWYIYKIEYYSDVRKDEILPFVITCRDLENIMLK